MFETFVRSMICSQFDWTLIFDAVFVVGRAYL